MKLGQQFFALELCDCERIILDEISYGECKRNDIATTYAFALQSFEDPVIDWPKVNHAIIRRWSMAGLKYIKNRAWKMVEDKRKENISMRGEK